VEIKPASIVICENMTIFHHGSVGTHIRHSGQNMSDCWKFISVTVPNIVDDSCLS